MVKRRIEEVISDVLRDEARKNALEFIAYLRANNIMIEDSDNYFWHPTYRAKGLCTINVEINDDGASLDTFINDLPGAWIASANSGECVDERTKEIIWANLRPCEITGCGDCSPGISKIILGKEFNNLCGSFLGIYDPDAETIECMKKIIDGLKSEILD